MPPNGPSETMYLSWRVTLPQHLEASSRLFSTTSAVPFHPMDGRRSPLLNVDTNVATAGDDEISTTKYNLLKPRQDTDGVGYFHSSHTCKKRLYRCNNVIDAHTTAQKFLGRRRLSRPNCIGPPRKGLYQSRHERLTCHNLSRTRVPVHNPATPTRGYEVLQIQECTTAWARPQPNSININ